jgi:hypothetical protein
MAAAALLCGASGVSAQDAAAPPAADALKFSSEAAVVIFQVQAAKTADFESAWMDIKSKLAASTNTDLKELGNSLNIYKMTGPPVGTDILYLFELDPLSKTLSYDPVQILYAPDLAVPRAEADAIYEKIRGSVTSLNPIPLQRVGGTGMGMGMGGM